MQAYYSATEEIIKINRQDVTTISDIAPDSVYSLLWEFDLNTFLRSAGIVAPRQLDINEQIHKKGTVDNTKYVYNVGTDEFHAEIEVKKDFDLNNELILTYSTVTTAPKANETLAMAALAKRLKVNSDSTVEVLEEEKKDVNNVIIPNNVNSTMSPVKVAMTTSGVGNSFSDGSQDEAVNNFLNFLKKKSSAISWYTPDKLNPRGMGVQVKNGLAQLFDRDPQLNNLLGSSANSGVFLDLTKIEAKMEDSKNEEDQFYTKMFSEDQLKEVLEAVYDKGDRVKYQLATDRYFYNFSPGDSITCVIRVVDSDTRPNEVSTDGKLGNSDRWLLTLKQKPSNDVTLLASYSFENNDNIYDNLINKSNPGTFNLSAPRGFIITTEPLLNNTNVISLSNNQYLEATGSLIDYSNSTVFTLIKHNDDGTFRPYFSNCLESYNIGSVNLYKDSDDSNYMLENFANSVNISVSSLSNNRVDNYKLFVWRRDYINTTTSIFICNGEGITDTYSQVNNGNLIGVKGGISLMNVFHEGLGAYVPAQEDFRSSSGTIASVRIYQGSLINSEINNVANEMLAGKGFNWTNI